jgi:hypothetical protein
VAGNPLIDQGTLNRIIASVSWTSFPSLNVTAPFLNKAAIRLALDGESTLFLPTLTGAVTSPEPYMMITATINLLKTQGLAAQYKAQMELQSKIGDGVVRPDTTILPPYDIVNCAIQTVREMDYGGGDAGWAVTVRGYYNINSSLFS